MNIRNEIEFVKGFFNTEKVKRILIAILTVVPIGWCWGYITLIQSNEYAFAVDYIKNNKKINEILGTIKSTRPGFTNFKMSYGGRISTAKFEVVIEADKHGVAIFSLKNTSNFWVINDASLLVDDGNIVVLTH